MTGQRGWGKAAGMSVPRDTQLAVAFARQLSLGSVGLAGGSFGDRWSDGYRPSPAVPAPTFPITGYYS